MDVIIIAVIGFVILIAAVVIAPTAKMAMGLAPFLYTNTRCSARSGLILKKKNYESLIGSTSMREVFAFLEDTAYSNVVEHVSDFVGSSLLLEKNLHATYAWLVTVVPESIAGIVEAMLGKFEVHDLKEALNHLRRSEPVGDMEHIRDEQLRIKLESATDFTSLTDSLEGSVYEPVFENKSLDDLAEITSALDRLYYTSVLKAIDACRDEKAALPFKDYWRRSIDAANIRLVLRKIDAKEDVAFIPGGQLTTKQFGDIVDHNHLMEVLEKTPYKDYVHEDIDLGMQQYLKRESGLINAKYPLKGGSIVRYIIEKEMEIRNLNVVLKLKSEGFDAETVTKLVVA